MRVADLTPAQADDLFAPEFNQATHGFSVGDIIRRSSATDHALAQADTTANIGVGLAIVIHVEDVNNFSALRSSNSQAVTITGHGLGSFGTKLYLSRTVAGQITATEPDPGWRVYLGFVIDANTIHWEPGWTRF
jgi:hypothetical protein